MSEINTRKTAQGGSDRATINVTDAARILGLSRGAAYAAARSGQLPALRIGKRYLVPRAALERLLAIQAGSPRPAA